MAYWGEALSHTRPIWYQQNVEAARKALAKLAPSPEQRLRKMPTERERGYLEAIEVLYGDGDKAAREEAFAQAMGKLAARHPDDLEAACLQALALMGTVALGDHHHPRVKQSAAIAERIFAVNPQHPGAAHVIIHAYDNRDEAAKALHAAHAYATIAPESSHAQHMPAHIFLQLGMWDEAAASDEQAFATSRALAKRRRLSIEHLDYHPQTWLVYEYLQQGRFQRAREAMRPFEEAMAATGNPVRKDELATLRAYYVVESRDWQAMNSTLKFANLDELFALGLAAINLRDRDRAAAVGEMLVKNAQGNPDPTHRAVAAIMLEQLGALVDLAEGRPKDAIQRAQRAATLEDPLPRSVGRHHPVKLSRELLGEILIEVGRPKDAMPQFERALWRAANRSRAVLGLARAAAQSGDTVRARQHYQQFLKNWSRADSERPELVEARTYKG